MRAPLPAGVVLVRRAGMPPEEAERCLAAIHAEDPHVGRPEDLARRSLVLALDGDGVAAGYAWWAPVRGPGAPGDIVSLHVRPSWRGRGLGTALVASLEDVLPDGFYVGDNSVEWGGRGSSFWLSGGGGVWHRAEDRWRDPDRYPPRDDNPYLAWGPA